MFVSVCLYSREFVRHQSYLIYVYHGAAIACKVNKVEVPDGERIYQRWIIKSRSDLERSMRGPGRQRILAS